MFKPLIYGPTKKWSNEGGKARLVTGRGWFIAPEGNGFDVAEVHCTNSQDEKTQEAYARLFAAAPDLMAACESALPRLIELFNYRREREGETGHEFFVVLDGGDGVDNDHADWGNARISCGA